MLWQAGGLALALSAGSVASLVPWAPAGAAGSPNGAGGAALSHRGVLDAAAANAPLIGSPDNLPRDVVRSILACWHAPHEGDEITLRMSFRRDGSVFGKPRITYMRSSAGADGEADLANSIFAAIAACSPLRFTPSLGAAIAGRVFLIRFTALRKEQRASHENVWS